MTERAEMGEEIQADVIDAILVKCGRCCCLCRRFLPTMLQVHHIIEKKDGGTDDPDNLFPVCLTCHSDVHTKRPFTQRFTIEELKQHRDAVFDQVANGKLVPPDDNYGQFAGRVQGPAAVASAVERPADSIVIAGDELIQPVLPTESVDILLAAAESQTGQVLMTRGSTGLSVVVDGHNFVPSRKPRDEARYKHAVEQLVKHGFLDGIDRVFPVSHRGFLLADQLRALRERKSSK